MNIFVDENQTNVRSNIRTEPLKQTASASQIKRFGQTVNANKILQTSRSQQASKNVAREGEPTRKKRRAKSTKREPEIAHFDNFDRESNFLSSAANSELQFWNSTFSRSSSLFSRNYSNNVDKLLEGELMSFGLDSTEPDDTFDMPLELELDDIDDLIAGL